MGIPLHQSSGYWARVKPGDHDSDPFKIIKIYFEQDHVKCPQLHTHLRSRPYMVT